MDVRLGLLSGDYLMKSILFLEKVFMRRKAGGSVLRGVELFNVNLVRQLAGQGYRVTMWADESWRALLEREFDGARVSCVYAGRLAGAATGWVLPALRLVSSRFDLFLIGNVANGLIPVIRILTLGRTFKDCLLIAHRETSRRFLRAAQAADAKVIAVNGVIAKPFSDARFRCTDVYYGIMNGESFHASASKPGNGAIKFCVLGQLDNAWKGSDTAVEAFGKMNGNVSRKCELHLASFSKPPVFEDSRIKAYGWLDAGAIPDLLRRMDVMIVPSRDEHVMRETFSQAIVQGMLTELPVIANNLSVLTEKLDEGGGLVFRTVDELAGQMKRLAEDPELRHRLGREGHCTARKRYIWNTADFARRYIES